MDLLVLRFEDMKRDLAAVTRGVSRFLGVEVPTGSALDEILERCGFEYMRRHGETFEMHPPHLLSVDAELFVHGTADRHRDVPAAARRRILAWCAGRMQSGPVSLAELYPGR